MHKKCPKSYYIFNSSENFVTILVTIGLDRGIPLAMTSELKRNSSVVN